MEEFVWMVLDRAEPFSHIVMDGHQYIYVCALKIKLSVNFKIKKL